MNVFIRLKLIACALIAATQVTMITAAPVTFWFSGSVSSVNNPSNAMPAGISVGTPFAGRISYDHALIYSSASNTFPAGTVADYYYRNPAGLGILVQVGGHTMTNAALVSQYNDGVHIYDDYNNSDEFIVEVGFNGLVAGDTTYTNCFFNLFLRDTTKTAYTNAALPATPPELGAFTANPTLSWYLRNPQGNNLGSFIGKITSLTTNELVLLNIRQLNAGQAQLGWPVNVPGFTAQFVTNVPVGNWQNVTNIVTHIGMEHTITVPVVGQPRIYRLKK